MLNKDESHAGVQRERAEQLRECFESTSRRAHADDREPISIGSPHRVAVVKNI
jgi:hypothetical protein